MQYIKHIIMLLISSSLFIGCVKPQPVVIYKTNIIYRDIPSYYFEDDITIPNPPLKHAYVKSTPYDRERLLVIHILDLYHVIGKYKLKLKAIRDYEIKIKNTPTGK